MRSPRNSRIRRMLIGAGVAAVAIGGVVYAAIPDSNGVIHGCYSDKDGDLRVVNSPDECRKKEIAVSWNKTGAKGDKGDTGIPGVPGATGPKGDTGATGPKGDTGAPGVPGVPGAQGDKGDTGAPGAKGDTGAPGAPGAPGATGPKGDTGAPGPGGTPLFAGVRSDGSLLVGSEGVTAVKLKTGVYRVTFPVNPTACGMHVSSTQYFGTGIIGVNGNIIDPPDTSHMFFSAFSDIGTANSLLIGERDAGTLVDGPFTVSIICP